MGAVFDQNFHNATPACGCGDVQGCAALHMTRIHVDAFANYFFDGFGVAREDRKTEVGRCHLLPLNFDFEA